jgi:hypothetical protein
MNIKVPTDEVFAVDAFGQFHPIRLPAEAFETLHKETLDSLREFVKGHRERFPKGPKSRKPKPR